MMKSKGIQLKDELIINQILAGRPDAFRLLILRYQQPVFRYLKSFGIKAEMVEEIAQETFLRAYKNLLTFDSTQASFVTWIFVIAKNLALNEMARHSYHKEEITDDVPEQLVSENPLSLLETKETSKKLQDVLKQLPLQFRNAITLFHLNEMSIEEISVIESCSKGTVKSRIFRGREILKRLLPVNRQRLGF